MERSVPMFLFLICVLVWAVLTVVFGWVVKSNVAGKERAGWVGKAAVEIASFPDKTRKVLRELRGYASGEFKDEAIRVQREDGVAYIGFAVAPSTSGPEIPGLLMRADRERITPGWRLLVGAFQIGDGIENAILLLSPDLSIVRVWALDEVPVADFKPRPKHRKFVHGVEILRSGAVIFTFDGSVSLQRFSACGEREWVAPGSFHHAVTLDGSGGSVWSLRKVGTNPYIVEVDVRDGSILTEIDIDDVIAANPSIDILEIRRKHPNDLGVNSRNTAGRWIPDRLHFNDVDPLPAPIADRFEAFQAGDLLVSARSLNLVFVLDPETLEIKWWRIGEVQRQHDPDWLASGEIMVFNNRMSRDFSEIVSIDPGTFERTVLLDGRDHDFYTRIRGKHQMLDDGTLVVTSPQQGRAFEVNPEGDRVLEFVNLKPGDETTNYVISELRWLPPDFFDQETWQCQMEN